MFVVMGFTHAVKPKKIIKETFDEIATKSANLLEGSQEELNIGQPAVVKDPGGCNIVLYKIDTIWIIVLSCYWTERVKATVLLCNVR